MKIASITLPYLPSSIAHKAVALSAGHIIITEHLKQVHGGYTRLAADGAWVASSSTLFYERVYRYEFACKDNEQEQSELRALAFRVKTRTDEQSIMVVHANGEVEFI